MSSKPNHMLVGFAFIGVCIVIAFGIFLGIKAGGDVQASNAATANGSEEVEEALNLSEPQQTLSDISEPIETFGEKAVKLQLLQPPDEIIQDCAGLYNYIPAGFPEEPGFSVAVQPGKTARIQYSDFSYVENVYKEAEAVPGIMFRDDRAEMTGFILQCFVDGSAQLIRDDDVFDPSSLMTYQALRQADRDILGIMEGIGDSIGD